MEGEGTEGERWKERAQRERERERERVVKKERERTGDYWRIKIDPRFWSFTLLIKPKYITNPSMEGNEKFALLDK